MLAIENEGKPTWACPRRALIPPPPKRKLSIKYIQKVKRFQVRVHLPLGLIDFLFWEKTTTTGRWSADKTSSCRPPPCDLQASKMANLHFPGLIGRFGHNSQWLAGARFKSNERGGRQQVAGTRKWNRNLLLAPDSWEMTQRYGEKVYALQHRNR